MSSARRTPLTSVKRQASCIILLSTPCWSQSSTELHEHTFSLRARRSADRIGFDFLLDRDCILLATLASRGRGTHALLVVCSNTGIMGVPPIPACCRHKRMCGAHYYVLLLCATLSCSTVAFTAGFLSSSRMLCLPVVPDRRENARRFRRQRRSDAECWRLSLPQMNSSPRKNINLGDRSDGNAFDPENIVSHSVTSSSSSPVNLEDPFENSLSPKKATTSTEKNGATVWKDRGALFTMTRPTSIPGTILFHMLGVALVVRGSSSHYWSFLLKNPTLWLTLLATNLVSATSMVVNDYYDAKLGRDQLKRHKALVNATVSMATAKKFLMYLYAAALVVSSFLPGVPTRLSVLFGLIMTYLYTKHLKPMTWTKNIVCASLIALAPWSSGSCAWNIMHSANIGTGGAVAFRSSITLVPEIWRVFTVLFFGVMGREILMDCNDAVADQAAGIRTVPVIYGLPFAVKTAAACTVLMALAAVLPPMKQLSLLPVSVPLWSSAPMRRLLLALSSSTVYLRSVWEVWKTNGEDPKIISKTVDSCLVIVFGLLLSFV